MIASPTNHPAPDAGRRAAIRMLLKYLEFGQLTDEEVREAGGIPAVVFTEDGLPIFTASACRCCDLRRHDLIEPVWTSRKGVQCRMQIGSGSQKQNRSEVVPLTPDFGEFLLRTPLDDRDGFVFNPSGTRTSGRPSAVWVGKVISKIGKLAGVLVADRDGKQKFASAHDIRRAFGKRWAYAEGMNPMKLKKLMRHASIDTTMRFYVDSDDADDALDDVFAAYHRSKRQAAKADRQTAEHAS